MTDKQEREKCQKCKGKGWYHTVLRDRSGRSRDGFGREAIVTCDHPYCDNGFVIPYEERRKGCRDG